MIEYHTGIAKAWIVPVGAEGQQMNLCRKSRCRMPHAGGFKHLQGIRRRDGEEREVRIRIRVRVRSQAFTDTLYGIRSGDERMNEDTQ